MKPRLLLALLMVFAAAAAGVFWWRTRSAVPAPGILGAAAYERTKAILAHGPRPPGSQALDRVRQDVRHALEAAGWSVVEQRFSRQTSVGGVSFTNLRARFARKGGDPWQGVPTGLLCAHIDSKAIPGTEFLGADDAASACAAIVELARHLAERKPEQAAALELVFFDGEEAFGPSITTLDGIYGSREYAGLWRGKPEKPRFGILLDMIGHRHLRIAVPSDSPAFLKDHLFASADEENARKHFVTAAGPIIDDHVPLNLVGIPTLDIIGDFARFDWWHNQGGGKDDLSIIAPESLDISMRVVLRMVDRLLGVDHPR